MAARLRPTLSLLLLFSTTALLSVVTPATFPSDTAALFAIKLSIDPSSIPLGSCLASWDFTRDPCDSASSERFTCGFACSDAAAGDLRRVTDLSFDPAGYSGSLPPTISTLDRLETLDLADNRLFGEIPVLPPTLRRLALSRNRFSGEIPVLPPSLEELYLDDNLLDGEIPAALGRIRRIEIQKNNLTGGIPDLRSLSELYFFDASDNRLSGEFPALPAAVVEVSLRGNLLAGELPGPAIAQIPALRVIDLSNNGFSGAVPAAVFEHPALEQLVLARNWFESVAPPWDGGASSQLVAVDIARNQLGGMLPAFLGSMPRLSAVNLEDNRFTGMIPAQYVVRAGLVPFGRLMLSGNYLFGPIPGPMGGIRDGTAVMSLADNCLFRCPEAFSFCRGRRQKTPATCRSFNPVIP